MKDKRTYKIIALLWFIWSLLHIVPGAMSIISALAGDITSIKFLFPETNPTAMTQDYPNEVKAILVTFGQHGFNLFWFGIVTLFCAISIWKKQSQIAIVIAAIVAGFADLGALFAVFMIGEIDIWGALIFLGTFMAIFLSAKVWESRAIS
ncbi:MAG: hypothetical protein AAF731_08760 [Bacteroidota bacterium]